jgi:hypothetical protein
MQHVIDQWEKVVSWSITFLVSVVMLLVGWIFNHILKSIDQRFLQMMQIFNDRMTRQDVEIKNVNHSLARLHERVDSQIDDNIDTERSPPRRRREDRRVPESREDQERSSDEF